MPPGTSVKMPAGGVVGVVIADCLLRRSMDACHDDCAAGAGRHHPFRLRSRAHLFLSSVHRNGGDDERIRLQRQDGARDGRHQGHRAAHRRTVPRGRGARVRLRTQRARYAAVGEWPHGCLRRGRPARHRAGRRDARDDSRHGRRPRRARQQRGRLAVRARGRCVAALHRINRAAEPDRAAATRATRERDHAAAVHGRRDAVHRERQRIATVARHGRVRRRESRPRQRGHVARGRVGAARARVRDQPEPRADRRGDRRPLRRRCRARRDSRDDSRRPARDTRRRRRRLPVPRIARRVVHVGREPATRRRRRTARVPVGRTDGRALNHATHTVRSRSLPMLGKSSSSF
ncbi:hypothetical protein F01_460042 [Burkholderia cenocepacia]|nr:hypothetical protein F01_460042 [Burkholderia cenocepacia]